LFEVELSKIQKFRERERETDRTLRLMQGAGRVVKL
jgi:hypothetical protein